MIFNMVRKILVSLFLSLLSLSVFAGPLKNYNDLIDLKIDRFDGIYAKGETINIEAVVDPSLEGRDLVMEIYENRTSIGKMTVPAKSGVVFSSSYDSSISVMVTLAPADDPKNDTRIGFVVAPEEFEPGYGCPKDFKKFWDKQKAALRAVPMDAKVVHIDEPVGVSRTLLPKYDVFDVKINMNDKTPCRGTMAKPKGAAPKSLPIVIFLHGAGVTGSRACTAVNFAMKGNGCMAMDLNAHGIEGDREKEYYDSLAAGPLYHYSTRDVVNHKSFYFRTMFLRIVRALDYMTQDPCWNGKILIYGSSQGGAQSAAIAGLDERIGAVVLLVPAMIDMCGARTGHSNSWCMPSTPVSAKTAKIVQYYDGANFLRFYKGKLHVEVGLVDTTCPAPNIFSGYNNAAACEKHIYTYPYRPHNEPGPRYFDAWKEKISAERDRFIYDYLTE